MAVEDQDVPDIVRRMMMKFEKTKGDYDKIYTYFDGGSIDDICRRLWTFCRKNFNYVIEDEEVQNVSSPITMLTNGEVDCKNYSLFIAGVLDAMRRHGKDLTWEFRYASYKLLQPPGHVFVVVNPRTDDIWVDPVLDQYNYKLFYWHKISKRAKGVRAIAGIPGTRRARVGSAESDLLSNLKEYADGIAQGVSSAVKTSSLNTITKTVLQSASMAIPGAPEAMAVLKSASTFLNDAFGAGSTAARLVSDLASFNVTGLFNDLFNGRTYNSDQYWGAVYYQNKVLGRNTTDQSQVVDSDVAPALKWFMDRLGIFISGREHILAIIKSPADYMALAKVNSDTTTDPTRVQAAYQVASRYFTNPNSFDQAGRGSWANTVGVYDQQIINLANQYGVTPEAVAAQTGYAYAAQDVAETNSTITGGSIGWLALAAAALIGVALTID